MDRPLTLISKRLRQMRRFALTLGGEVLQSAFHFALNIVLVRALPEHDYGIFAIVMLMGGISLGYVRALVGMPVTLALAHRPQHRATLAVEVGFGSAALLLCCLAGIGSALLLLVWLDGTAFVGGLFIALWSLRSYVRSLLLARRLQAIAVAGDATFALSGAVLALALVRFDGPDPLARVFVALAAANVLAIVAVFAMRRKWPRITLRRATLRHVTGLRHQLLWSALGTTTATIQAQGQVFLVAALAGPAAYAPIAAVLVLFGPIRIITTAVGNLTQPDIAASLARGDIRRIRRLLAMWSGLLACGSLVYGTLVVAALPMLGSTVFQTHSKYVIAGLSWAISASYLLYLMPRLLMEALRMFRLITVITAVSGVAGLAAVTVLLLVATPAWSLLGTLLSELIVLGCCWIVAARALGRGEARRSGTQGEAATGAVRPRAEASPRARTVEAAISRVPS